MRVAVFASGKGTNFENIVTKKYNTVEIVLLICDKKEAYAITRAQKLNIPYEIIEYKNYENKKEAELQILKVLKDNKIEFIILAGYMRILENTILESYHNKIINIHPSLLPSFKGVNGIKDAYEYGVKVGGVTVHYVNHELDGGKIIAQKAFDCENMSFFEYENKIHELEYELYPQVIKKLLDEV